MTYFAWDGNYGDSHGLIIINTVQWTDDDWQQIDEATDRERFDVALSIAERYS